MSFPSCNLVALLFTSRLAAAERLCSVFNLSKPIAVIQAFSTFRQVPSRLKLVRVPEHRNAEALRVRSGQRSSGFPHQTGSPIRCLSPKHFTDRTFIPQTSSPIVNQGSTPNDLCMLARALPRCSTSSANCRNSCRASEHSPTFITHLCLFRRTTFRRRCHSEEFLQRKSIQPDSP